MTIGFLTPAMAAHSPNVHKGYDLYSAALPAATPKKNGQIFRKLMPQAENPTVRK